MTPTQVRAVIDKMLAQKESAAGLVEQCEADAQHAGSFLRGAVCAFEDAARILAEALAESEAAPVWCEKFGPKGYACVIRHALGTPHESRNAAGDVIDTWGP